jgi:hypothetical protein
LNAQQCPHQHVEQARYIQLRDSLSMMSSQHVANLQDNKVASHLAIAQHQYNGMLSIALSVVSR